MPYSITAPFRRLQRAATRIALPLAQRAREEIEDAWPRVMDTIVFALSDDTDFAIENRALRATIDEWRAAADRAREQLEEERGRYNDTRHSRFEVDRMEADARKTEAWAKRLDLALKAREADVATLTAERRAVIEACLARADSSAVLPVLRALGYEIEWHVDGAGELRHSASVVGVPGADYTAPLRADAIRGAMRKALAADEAQPAVET